MTLILAATSPNHSFIASDQFASQDGYVHKAQTKIVRLQDVLIGFAGSYSLQNCIAYHCNLTKQSSKESNEAYIFGKVYHTLRKCCYKYNLLSIDQGDLSIPGDMLLTYKGAIFHFQNCCNIVQVIGSVAAIGSGRDCALGAFKALENTDSKRLTTIDKIKETFKVVSHFNPIISKDYDLLYYRHADLK